jgi:hypothetical protein
MQNPSHSAPFSKNRRFFFLETGKVGVPFVTVKTADVVRQRPAVPKHTVLPEVKLTTSCGFQHADSHRLTVLQKKSKLRGVVRL